jgi:AAA+ ATPase superfamily predicted ATPase
MKELKFVNRQNELETLERLYQKEGFQFIPIYGRRRIGKTRLIQEFIKQKPAIYFFSDSVSESEQLKNIGRAVGEFFNDQILIDAGFKDWYQFFSYLQQKATKRLIVVIDEFPYLINSNPAISSIFQKGIDEYLKNSNIFMVIMGSSVGMMEKEVLHYKAPLYGRRTASMEIKEMNFSCLSEFFPDKKFDELVRIYSVFGTIPAYIGNLNFLNP